MIKISVFGLTLLCASLSRAEEFDVGKFTFDDGSAWQAVEHSPMVAAAFKHLKADLEVRFYHFGQGQGGGIAANFDRWIGQFEGMPVVAKESHRYGEQEVAILTVNGTYLEGPPMMPAEKKTPMEEYMMLGAVIPNAEGDVFLKLTGPEAAVEAVKADFMSLASSPFTDVSVEE